MFEFDLSSQTSTPIGSAGPYSYSSLAYDGSTLYGGNGNGEFFSVDFSTGVQTLINGSSAAINAMEYYNGTLYGGDLSGQFFTVDTTTGNTVNIGSVSTYGIAGLAVSGGEMYGISVNGELYNVNLTTGAQSYIGDTGVAWTRALTVVPEPISSTLFIVGGATLGFRRFRKKFKK